MFALIATLAAPEIGVDANAISLYTSLVYAAACLSSAPCCWDGAMAR
ncbi:MAG TPA: hypothetical protein VN681_05275 [Stellaceae bacterium]|nr:hypothetical protein [Stellaceae bacterium]